VADTGLHCWHSCRSEASPEVAAFSAAAAVACEGLLHPRASAMTSVRQYSGMEAVPPLCKPRMWSVLDPELEPEQQQGAGAGSGAAGGSAAGAAAAAPAVTPLMLLQEFMQYMESRQEGSAGQLLAGISQAAVGPAQKVGNQQQAAGAAPVASLPAPAPAAAVPAAAAPAVPAQPQAMDVSPAVAAVPKSKPAAQQHQVQAAPAAPAQTAAQQHQVQAAAAAAAAPAAGLGLGAALTQPAFAGDSSSDSEGELPEIDSGGSDDDEDE
jgi:hypothetical protein